MVILDELDLLLRKRSSILYHFFEWCGWKSARLVVIAIANTMDLPERYLPHRIASRMGNHRINFKPYTYPQLMAIISHRRAEWRDCFHPDALEYCARKVSAVSGDARRALSLAKRAIDWVRTTPALLPPNKLITIPLMEQAIQMTFAGNPVQIMGDLSLQQKLLLLSLLLASRSLGLCLVPFERVCENHWQLLRVNGMGSISFASLQGVFSQLESARLVGRREAAPGALALPSSPICAHSLVRLCIPDGEVALALRQEALLNKHIQV